MSKKLALFGGEPVIKKNFSPFNTIDDIEVEAVSKVVKSGILSGFIGAAGDAFLGGPEVQKFEKKVKSYFGVKHAISVNSWTSGLIAAVGSIGLEPGDEVITTPWTMSATAMSILHWNAIPVFADIDKETYNISPSEVRKKITKKTKAILSVDIFGQSADTDTLMKIAKEYDLKVISDSAQAPGTHYKNSYTSTNVDIGGFSFNYHKHIHCGEGGVLITNDDKLANKMRLIRNHAESVIDEDTDNENLVNMIGHNFRLGEIEAVIASAQLDKLKENVLSRQRAADQLTKAIRDLPGIKTPFVSKDSTHAYYVYAFQIDKGVIGVSKDKIFNALKFEGVPALMSKYQNIHLLPIFQKKIAYGSKNFPWSISQNYKKITYTKGICPIAEEMQDEKMLGISLCMHEFSENEIDLISMAFRKVWDNLDLLKQ